MAKTPVTSSTAYADADDLMACYDAGRIGDFAKDNGVQLTPTQIRTNTNVLFALLRASGEVEQACVRGGRYTPADLNALTGAAQAALIGLVCDLAYFRLARRKKHDTSADPVYKEAMAVLQALSNGDTIFGFQEVIDAGNMEAIDTSEDEDGILQRPADQLRRLFGARLDEFGSDPIRGVQ